MDYNPQDTTLVVIPYYGPGAQGRELELAIAGWNKHFKEKHLIIVVGESIAQYTAHIKDKNVICINSRRVSPREGQYRQHLDYVSCFKKVHTIFKESKGFVFTADDGYAVRDFDLNDIKVLKMHAPSFAGNPYSKNGWQRDMAKTRQLLDREGLPCRNFCTHIPQWYEWDKLEEIWEEYHMDTESYLFEEIYFNKFYKDETPILLNNNSDRIRYGSWKSEKNMEEIKNAFKTKIWITNSVEGWFPELEQMLERHYEEKP